MSEPNTNFELYANALGTNATTSAAASASTTNTAAELYTTVATSNSDLVDFSNGLRKAKDGKIDTLEELNALLLGQAGGDVEKIQQQISALEAQLVQINNEIQQYEANIATSQRNIDEANASLTRLNRELESELANFENLSAQERDLTSRFEREQATLEGNQNRLAEVAQNIETQSQNYSDAAEDETSRYIESLREEYNEEEDGSWNAFVAKKMGSFSPSVSTSSLDGLQEEAEGLQSSIRTSTTSLNALSADITNVTNNLNASSEKIASLRNEIATTENLITAETANIQNYNAAIAAKNTETQSVQSQIDAQKVALNAAMQNYGGISEEEWAIVQEKGIDLSATLPDGSPKYIIAAGKSDNKFHIYDMSQSGASLVRQFADGQGFDIIASGNGYMNGYKDVTGTGQGSPVFSVSSEGGCLNQSCACYTTCSPLSFDLEGDGIKTGVLITYDIDGDGKLDTINDSQDAILVFDKDGDGISGEDGSETFGDNTDLDGDGKKDGFSDGFAALKAYAAQFGLVGEGDNTLDENDLKILEEKGLKIKTDGYNSEGKSLLELGITEINLAQTTETTMIDNFDGNGNQLMTQEGATFKINGETRQYADLWHVKHENVPTQQKSLNIFDKALGQKSSYVATKKDNSKYEDMFKATKNKNKLVNAQTDSALNMMKQILKKYSK